jgi:hypothetical protein
MPNTAIATANGSGTPPAGARKPRSAPAFPLSSLAEARAYLAAPFPGACIGFLPNRLGKNSQWAALFAYVDVTSLQDRLDLVVGPEHWSHDVSVLDADTLAVRLTVCGVSHTEVGQGADRWSQSANALKRCGRHFGIGRYLAQMPQQRMKIGNGPGEIPVTQAGKPYVSDKLLAALRARYEKLMGQQRGRWGEILEHHGSDGDGAGVEREPIAGPEGEPPPEPSPVGEGVVSPHGIAVRNAAAERGLSVAALANVILVAAGDEPRSSDKAAAVLEPMLARLPEPIANRALALMQAPHPAATGAQARAPEAPASDARGIAVDFASLRPDTRAAA